jgi:hypothetical protein
LKIFLGRLKNKGLGRYDGYVSQTCPGALYGILAPSLLLLCEAGKIKYTK